MYDNNPTVFNTTFWYYAIVVNTTFVTVALGKSFTGFSLQEKTQVYNYKFNKSDKSLTHLSGFVTSTSVHIKDIAERNRVIKVAFDVLMTDNPNTLTFGLTIVRTSKNSTSNRRYDFNGIIIKTPLNVEQNNDELCHKVTTI